MNAEIDYPWICGSPSKKTKYWLRFKTQSGALDHQLCMDVALQTYDDQAPTWNKDFWPERPASWIVQPNPLYQESSAK